MERLQLSQHTAQGHGIYQHRPFRPINAVFRTKPHQLHSSGCLKPMPEGFYGEHNSGMALRSSQREKKPMEKGYLQLSGVVLKLT